MIVCCEDAPLLSALREFVLVGETQEPGNKLPQIDDPRFGIATRGKSRTIRRTWLDTFDWRLFRAGLTLELLAGRGTAELVLTGRNGELVATEPVGQAGTGNGSRPIRWPNRIEQLPAGPLRGHLAPVVGVRALLPVTKATSVLTELRAVNGDDKTIAVLALDRMSLPRSARASQPQAYTRL